MILFLVGIVLLILGYYTYGAVVEKILAPDDRLTPAIKINDGVDYVVLPHWKNMLIQLLNIAGIGPVIGVILGIKFGSIVFLLIPIGCVFGGAVHDFVSGMMILRNRGANLPQVIRLALGNAFYSFFSVFMLILLILVVTVFINVPAQLLDNLFPKTPLFWPIVGAIFLYYIAATLFPVDKIIGHFYPIFGGILLVGTGAIFLALLLYENSHPNFLCESEAFKECASKMPPIIPCLFVTIACGILSGFHATQSPIIARTMKSEREARANFYGMMIAEGIIAMIWAAGALAIYNLFPEYLTKGGTDTLGKITTHFLGAGLGVVTILAVVVLAITTGDTALRSLRLSVAEMGHFSQKPLWSRFAVTLPFIAIISAILFWSNKSPKTFGELWNYFAWGNQVLAASTLMAVTVWLWGQKKNIWITLIPGFFMTFVVLSFILWTSKTNQGPAGFGLPLQTAYIIAFAAACVCWLWVAWQGRKARREGKFLDSDEVQEKESEEKASFVQKR